MATHNAVRPTPQSTNETHINKLKIDDILSLSLLQPLTGGYPLLPFTGSSMRPFCLNHIINDILVNNRKQIIEFGSGISTIVIARAIKRNNLTTKIISIEHNESWAKVLESQLQREGLQHAATIVLAPLTRSEWCLGKNEWYDPEILRAQLAGKIFDMMIVDGPPAWQKSKSRSRYPAFPFMMERLSANYAIYLDDANRDGERYILNAWEKKMKIKFTITGATLAYAYSDDAFYTEPFTYYNK